MTPLSCADCLSLVGSFCRCRQQKLVRFSAAPPRMAGSGLRFQLIRSDEREVPNPHAMAALGRSDGHGSSFPVDLKGSFYVPRAFLA
jgi:hypothetical protein